MEIFVLAYENGNMRPVGIIPGMEVGEIKENYEVGEFCYHIL
jgi:hypothetical protein